MKRSVFFAGTVFLILSVRADQIVLPAGFANADADGRGGFQLANERIQQAYSKSLFGGISGNQIEISEVRFRLDPAGPAVNQSVEMQVRLFSTTDGAETARSTWFSESSAAVVGLPRSRFAWSGNPGLSFDVVVPLPNHYLYDRTQGNLVIDFSVFDPGQTPANLDASNGADGISMVQGTIGGLPIVQWSGGDFVTALTFGVVSVPEPGVLAFAAVGAVMIYRRRT